MALVETQIYSMNEALSGFQALLKKVRNLLKVTSKKMDASENNDDKPLFGLIGNLLSMIIYSVWKDKMK